MIVAAGLALTPPPVPATAGAPVRATQEGDAVLTIVEPDRQTYLVNRVRLRARVEPADGVAEVEFFVDGARACVAPDPPFECAWDAGPRAVPRVVRAVARLRDGGRLVQSVLTRGRAAAALSAGTSVIIVPVMVEDRRGRLVEGLTAGDFALFEDGVRQDVSFFEAGTLPLELVLAVDFSASMSASMDTLRFAARQFIGALAGSGRLSLIAFNDRVFVLARHERERSTLIEAVGALPPAFGGTALLDAVVQALDLQGGDFTHKAVVVFSDGDDRHSLSTMDLVERRIRTSQASVYVVSLGQGRTRDRVRSMLARLTGVSGGRAFSIDRIDDLHGALTHVRDSLQHRYVLAYQSSNPSRDRGWRRIEVRTRNRRHVVTAREGYLTEPPF